MDTKRTYYQDYYELNKEKIKKYYWENREYRLAYQHEYRRLNSRQQRDYQSKYYIKHRKVYRAKQKIEPLSKSYQPITITFD
jgi:hypothetical protein